MPVGKTAIRVVLIVLGLLVLTAVVLYWQASRIPEAYKPANLTEPERKAAAKDFVNNVALRFSNLVERNEPVSFTLTQENINRYLASMPEIEALKVDGKKEDVHRKMEQIGLADPAVAIEGGTLTLMARSTEHNKVVSLGISFDHAEDGSLQVQLDKTRVGELGVPRGFIKDKVEELKKAQRARAKVLQEAARGGKAPPGTDPSWGEIELVLAKLIAAIDEDPVPMEFPGSIGKKWVRIEAVKAAGGELTLDLKPLGRRHREK